MAVVAQKRRLSKTEHYKVAIRIRREIYKWVNRNFGVKDDRVFESMGYSPKWYSDASKYHLYSLASDLVIYVTEGDSIGLSYNMKPKNRDLKIEYYTRALSAMRGILSYLWEVWKDFPYNLNYLRILIELCDKEKELLNSVRDYTYRYKIEGKT